MNKYKTLEELKEELGDEFDDYMYKANIELLNRWDKLKEWIKSEDDWVFIPSLAVIRSINDKMQELENGENND